MHEISIAESIVEIAEARARGQNAVSIQVVKIRPGEFTNIVREALEFAFPKRRHHRVAVWSVSRTIDIVPAGHFVRGDGALRSLLRFCEEVSLPDCVPGLGQCPWRRPEVRFSAAADFRYDCGFGDQVGGDSLDGRADDHSRRRGKERRAQHARLRRRFRAARRGDFRGRHVDG
jgi:hypothetical protein